MLSFMGSFRGPFAYGGVFGYREEASGLKLLGHRLYDPAAGRFLSRDPIKDGRNWYAYCSNNPVSAADPEGLKIKLVGFTDAEAKEVRALIHQLGGSEYKVLRDMIYDLVNDKIDHIITPMRERDNRFAASTGNVVTFYPFGYYKAPDGKGHQDIYYFPLAVLAHELAHQWGKPDPGGSDRGLVGGIAAPGDAVWDVENVARRLKGGGRVPRVYWSPRSR